MSESPCVPTDEVDIRLSINDEPVRDRVPARMTLADFVRDRRRLTGTHLACGVGVCGSCLVLIDGRSARACTTLAAQATGRQVTTVEGLGSEDGGLGEVQEAFVRLRAAQCGFCTPGFVVLVAELLAEVDDGARPDDEAIRSRLASHLCRCTGYLPLLEATRDLIAARLAGRPR